MSVTAFRTTRVDEAAARRELRRQIARLEGQRTRAFLAAREAGIGRLEMSPIGGARGGSLLDLEALTEIRDALLDAIACEREVVRQAADAIAANRLLLERALLEPGKYRWLRLPREALGEQGCGAYEVRPRLGLIGMLAGWWEVKLSSGCPLRVPEAAHPPQAHRRS